MVFVATLSNGLPGNLSNMVAPPPKVMSHAALWAYDSHTATSTSVGGSHLSDVGSATVARSNSDGGPGVANRQSSHDRIRRYLAREAQIDCLNQLEGRVDIGACVRIGSGSWGDVLLAQDKVSMQRLAVKVISLSRPLDAQAGGEDRFRREIQIMQDLEHPNIVQLVDVFVCGSKIQQVASEPPYLCIAMEYVYESEPLSRVIMSSGGSPKLALQVLWQLASALALMHQRGLVHRDVWSENVLLGKTGHVVLVDLGCAEYYRSGPALSNKLNIPYISPQAAMGLPQQPGDDCWAVGLLISEMVTGRFVSDRLGRTDVPLHSNQPELNRARGETLLQGGQLMGQLCTRLLEFEPSRRLTMAEVVVEGSTSRPKHMACALPSQQSGRSASSQDSSTTRSRQASQSAFVIDGSVTVATAAGFERSQAAAAGESMRMTSAPTPRLTRRWDPKQLFLQAQQDWRISPLEVATGTPQRESADRTKPPPRDPGQLVVQARPPIIQALSRSRSDVSLGRGNVDETLVSSARPSSGTAIGKQVTYQSRSHKARYSGVVLGRSAGDSPGWIVQLNRGAGLKKVEDHELWRLSFAAAPLSTTTPSSGAATSTNAQPPTPGRETLVSIATAAPLAPSAGSLVHGPAARPASAGMVARPRVPRPGPPRGAGPGRFSLKPTSATQVAGRGPGACGPERSSTPASMRRPTPPRQNSAATPTCPPPPHAITQAPHLPTPVCVGRVGPSRYAGQGSGGGRGIAAGTTQRAPVRGHPTAPGGSTHAAAVAARPDRFQFRPPQHR